MNKDEIRKCCRPNEPELTSDQALSAFRDKVAIYPEIFRKSNLTERNLNSDFVVYSTIICKDDVSKSLLNIYGVFKTLNEAKECSLNVLQKTSSAFPIVITKCDEWNILTQTPEKFSSESKLLVDDHLLPYEKNMEKILANISEEENNIRSRRIRELKEYEPLAPESITIENNIKYRMKLYEIVQQLNFLEKKKCILLEIKKLLSGIINHENWNLKEDWYDVYVETLKGKNFLQRRDLESCLECYETSESLEDAISTCQKLYKAYDDVKF